MTDPHEPKPTLRYRFPPKSSEGSPYEPEEELITYIIVITVLTVCLGWSLLTFCLWDKIRWCTSSRSDVDQADGRLRAEQLSWMEMMQLDDNDPPPPYSYDLDIDPYHRYR